MWPVKSSPQNSFRTIACKGTVQPWRQEFSRLVRDSEQEDTPPQNLVYGIYMRWQVRCALEGCKSLMFPDVLRRVKRCFVKYHPDFGRTAFALDEGILQIKWLREELGSLAGKTILEIGSGWEPLLPILYALLDVKHVYLTDLRRLMDVDTISAAMQGLAKNLDRIASELQLTNERVLAVLSQSVINLDAFLQGMRFSYLAPCDCRKLQLPPASIDVVTSRSVFEHVPPPVIEEIIKESQRVLVPGGLLCHFIDNSDHWAHHDKAISRVNFLQYTDRQFRWTWINPLHYQNRLRHSDYLAMLARHGLRILREQRVIEPSTLDAVPKIQLAPRFRQFTQEDLATTDSYLLARKVD